GEQRRISGALRTGGSDSKLGAVGEVIVIKLLGWLVIKDSKTATHRHLSHLGRIPGKPDARANRVQGVVQEVLPARHHPVWNHALQAATGTWEGHVANAFASQAVGRIKEVLVPQAKIYREVRPELPVVLNERRQRSVAHQAVQFVEARTSVRI